MFEIVCMGEGILDREFLGLNMCGNGVSLNSFFFDLYFTSSGVGVDFVTIRDKNVFKFLLFIIGSLFL